MQVFFLCISCNYVYLCQISCASYTKLTISFIVFPQVIEAT